MAANIYGRAAAVLVVCTLVLATGANAAGQDLRLVSAAAERDTDAVRALLNEGIDVNTPRADGVTALLWAAHLDDLDTADLLLDAGANVNSADDHGVTPLERAAENASTAMVEKLLAAGANVNAAQTSRLRPLMTAARTGNIQVVEALVAHGADINAATTETKSTALMWAVAAPHPDVVRALLGGALTRMRPRSTGSRPSCSRRATVTSRWPKR